MTSPITDRQRTILEAAAERPDGLAAPPAHLPPAPRGAVAKALLNAGLLEPAGAAGAEQQDLAWKVDGAAVLLRITDAGREAMDAGHGTAPRAAAETPLAAQGAPEPHTTHGTQPRPPRPPSRAWTRASCAAASRTAAGRPRSGPRARRAAGKPQRPPPTRQPPPRRPRAAPRACAQR